MTNHMSGDQKGGKVFLHIKQELQVQERRRAAVPSRGSRDCNDQVFFVDRSRQAGVVQGTKDLKADVKQREMKDR